MENYFTVIGFDKEVFWINDLKVIRIVKISDSLSVKICLSTAVVLFVFLKISAQTNSRMWIYI